MSAAKISRSKQQKEIFPRCYDLIVKQFGYTESQFELLTKEKCPQVNRPCHSPTTHTHTPLQQPPG